MSFLHASSKSMKHKNHKIFFFTIFRYAVDFLVDEHDFKLVSVPDLLHPNILRGCGMDVDGERTQVCLNPFSWSYLYSFMSLLLFNWTKICNCS